MIVPLQQSPLPPALNTSGSLTQHGSAVMHGKTQPVNIPHATDPKQ